MNSCVKYTYEGKEYVTLPAPPEVIKYTALERDKKTQRKLEMLYDLYDYTQIPVMEDAVVTPSGNGHYVHGHVTINGTTYEVDTLTNSLMLTPVDVPTPEPTVEPEPEEGPVELVPELEEVPADNEQELEEVPTDNEQELEEVPDTAEPAFNTVIPEPAFNTSVVDSTNTEDSTNMGIIEPIETEETVEEKTVEVEAEDRPSLHLVPPIEKEEEKETEQVIEFYRPADPERQEDVEKKVPDEITIPRLGVSFGNSKSYTKKYTNHVVGYKTTKKIGISLPNGSGNRVKTPLPTFKKAVESTPQAQVNTPVEEPVAEKDDDYDAYARPVNREPIHVIIDTAEPEEEEVEEVFEEVEDEGIRFTPTAEIDMSTVNNTGDISNTAAAYIEKLSEEDRALIEKIPIELFAPIQEYTSDAIDTDTLLRDGRDYCINNRWFNYGTWWAIDSMSDMKRYFYNEVEKIFTSVTYQTRINWAKIH